MYKAKISVCSEMGVQTTQRTASNMDFFLNFKPGGT
jgi:hypothetical protein